MKTRLVPIKLLLLTALIIAALSSCSDITEEIVLDESGSGTYLTLMDMGKAFEEMADMMSDSMDVEPSNMWDELTEAQDSTISFYEMYLTDLDSNKVSEVEGAEILKDIYIRMKVDPVEKTFMTGIYAEFNSVDHLNDMIRKMQEMRDQSDTTDAEINVDVNTDQLSYLDTVQWTIQDGTFNRPTVVLDDEEDLMMGSDSLDAETEAFMKEMIGDAMFISSITLPGTVEILDGEHYRAEGNKLILEISWQDLLKNNEFPGVRARYKK